MNKTIILFDIDYTLFDTTLYKKSVAKKIFEKIQNITFEKVHSSIEEVYRDIRQFGSFDPVAFAKEFIKKFPDNFSEKEIEEVWVSSEVLQSALYPEVVPTLLLLQKQGYILGIFSSGETEFQLAKISHVQDFFQQDHLHIAAFKEEKLEELLGEYRNESIVLIDDYIEILQKAKTFLPNLRAIWMKRGRYAEKVVLNDFMPDNIIETLDELPGLIDK